MKRRSIQMRAPGSLQAGTMHQVQQGAVPVLVRLLLMADEDPRQGGASGLAVDGYHA